LREKIAALESKHQEELTELRRGDNGRPLPTGVTANPVYQSVRLALNEASVEVAALSRTLASHDAEVDELRRLVNTMPEVEAEFARLNRDYDVQRSQYSALVERLEQIRLGQDAERTNAGIVMEVLDPPTASVGPVAPNRPMLITLVFLASLGLGAGLAWVLSKLNPVFNRSHELEQITGLPVLGSVTLTGLDQVVAHNRRGYLRYAATAGALFLAFGAVLITDLMSA
jgi:uncharacterized protein involved in exopolysaccharide biosynthesis